MLMQRGIGEESRGVWLMSLRPCSRQNMGLVILGQESKRVKQMLHSLLLLPHDTYDS